MCDLRSCWTFSCSIRPRKHQQMPAESPAISGAISHDLVCGGVLAWQLWKWKCNFESIRRSRITKKYPFFWVQLEQELRCNPLQLVLWCLLSMLAIFHLKCSCCYWVHWFSLGGSLHDFQPVLTLLLCVLTLWFMWRYSVFSCLLQMAALGSLRSQCWMWE